MSSEIILDMILIFLIVSILGSFNCIVQNHIDYGFTFLEIFWFVL